jgi:cupin superfamily acireductone dioxygenase involved in methionine salvage
MLILKKKIMENRIYTKIKASKEFWQDQLKNLVTNGSRFIITELNGDEIQIVSENMYFEMDIVELSRQNPDQLLIATWKREDHYENLVATYKYIGGKRELLREEYKYCFGISTEDLNELPPGMYDLFKKKALRYFQKVDNYRVRTSASDPSFQEAPEQIFGNDEDSLLIPSVEFLKDGFKITAKKTGFTYLHVSVDRLYHESDPRIDDHLSEEFDDWMSEEYDT